MMRLRKEAEGVQMAYNYAKKTQQRADNELAAAKSLASTFKTYA
jgi:hypothetical protein